MDARDFEDAYQRDDKPREIKSNRAWREECEALRAELEAVKKERNSIIGGYNIQAANLELMRKQRDELVAALEKARDLIDKHLKWDRRIDDDMDFIDGVLAKLGADKTGEVG